MNSLHYVNCHHVHCHHVQLQRWCACTRATETSTEFSLPLAESDARRIELDPTNPNRIWWSGDTSSHLGYIELVNE